MSESGWLHKELAAAAKEVKRLPKETQAIIKAAVKRIVAGGEI